MIDGILSIFSRSGTSLETNGSNVKITPIRITNIPRSDIGWKVIVRLSLPPSVRLVLIPNDYGIHQKF